MVNLIAELVSQNCRSPDRSEQAVKTLDRAELTSLIIVDMLTIIFAKTLFLSDRPCHPKKLQRLT
ncbi:hypothetical protein QT989_14135 [Microcoleus sp. SVA1_B6]|uniref:hypothetical protein n=1 Tax=Microcoleus sp. SVA1_B6 TaxID=2818952 RepID=UPI002FD67BE9